MDNICSLEELRKILIDAGIDLSLWGIGEAKTVENLWSEVLQGETQFQLNPVLRTAKVVQLVIRRDNKVLCEVGQDLEEGRRRNRNILPSEKMKPGEDYEAAVRRCIETELRKSATSVAILKDTNISWSVEKASPSYPGLRSKYFFQKVEVTGLDLPDGSFSTAEAPGNPDDPVKRHYWEWRDEPVNKTNK